MAGGAGQIGMAIDEKETGLAVIKYGVKEGIKTSVARGAIRGLKLARDGTGSPRNCEVRWIRGLLKILHVARITIGRKPQVISRGSILMAVFALHNRVLAEEWKSIKVVLNRLHRNLPAENCVALRAIGAELRAVNVRMAIRTVLSNIGENGLGMASGAGYFFVHSAQRVSRGVVVKFRDGADRGPAGGGVAIFARYIKRSVRTSTWLPLCRCGHNAGEAEKCDHKPTSHLDPRVKVCTIVSVPTLICSKEAQQGKYPLIPL
jgi:hypothetical protein